MFGKLKEKLKGALSIFSKKTEEEAVDKPIEETKEEVKEKSVLKELKVKAEPVKEPVKEKITEKIKADEQKKKETKEKVSEKQKVVKEEKKEAIPEKEKRIEKAERLKEVKEIEEKTEPQKKGFFGKLKEIITTRTISANKFEELFWDLELALLENNVSVEVVEKIKENLKNELVEKPLPRDVSAKIEETLKQTISEILTFKRIDLLNKSKEKKPLIIAFFGINGSGKTTSIAKLAYYFQQKKLSVVFAACDTFRAAAIQQLEEHADRLGVKIIKHDYGSDAAAVAFDAVKYAQKNGNDIVMIDTAGRLHSNTNLMAELEKIIRVTKPDVKIFVGESITGNDCIEQAKRFNELVEMDGVILTKADVDEKGGAPISIAYTIKKPILFLGVGQRYQDLEEFDKDKIIEKLF